MSDKRLAAAAMMFVGFGVCLGMMILSFGATRIVAYLLGGCLLIAGMIHDSLLRRSERRDDPGVAISGAYQSLKRPSPATNDGTCGGLIIVRQPRAEFYRSMIEQGLSSTDDIRIREGLNPLKSPPPPPAPPRR